MMRLFPPGQYSSQEEGGDESLEWSLERLLADAACGSGQGWEMEDTDPDVLEDPIMQLDIQVCRYRGRYCTTWNLLLLL